MTHTFPDLFPDSSAGLPLGEFESRGDFSLVDHFLAADRAEQLRSELAAGADWRDEYLQMFGKRIRSPRRVCWYGDPGVGYVYSGEEHRAEGWLGSLETLKGELERCLGVSFNFVLLNYYRDHNDSMGWHADNEPELGREPVIASISLGAARDFRIRTARKVAGQRRTSRVLELGHGSLLVMQGKSQALYQHALPKSSRPCGPRLNLTFRNVKVHSDLARPAGSAL